MDGYLRLDKECRAQVQTVVPPRGYVSCLPRDAVGQICPAGLEVGSGQSRQGRRMVLTFLVGELHQRVTRLTRAVIQKVRIRK